MGRSRGCSKVIFLGYTHRLSSNILTHLEYMFLDLYKARWVHWLLPLGYHVNSLAKTSRRLMHQRLPFPKGHYLSATSRISFCLGDHARCRWSRRVLRRPFCRLGRGIRTWSRSSGGHFRTYGYCVQPASLCPFFVSQVSMISVSSWVEIGVQEMKECREKWPLVFYPASY